MVIPARAALVALALAFLLCTNGAFAQSVSARLESVSEGLLRSGNSAFAFTQREAESLQSSQPSPGTDQRISDLQIVNGLHDQLLAASREIEFLQKMVILTMMISDKKFFPHAQGAVDGQKEYAAKRARRATGYLGAQLRFIRGSEANQQALQMRDAIKEAAFALESIRIVLPVTP